jgi:chromosome condensin MukBEF ATPase and DNA-binding subunit MukB
MTNLEREIGGLEARMETVEGELQAIRSDVREIRDALVGARAGWKTMAFVVSLSASSGALMGQLLPLIGALARLN